MAWKDKLRPASFRGVPFFIDSSQFTGGRRVTFHEFPDRNRPFPEDLGKAGQTFKVEGHILGDNYFETKAKIMEAVEKEGPGELVHPYFGTLFVQCGSFSVDEDTKEGRIAKLSFLFYEGGDDNYPKAVDDKHAILGDKTANALANSKKAFDKKFSITGMPGFAVDSARGGVAKLADMFTNATKGAVTVAEDVANLAYSIRNLKAEVNDLLQAPAKLSQRILDSFALLEAALQLPKGKLKAFSDFAAFGLTDPPIPGQTEMRDRERDNNDAFTNFIREVGTAKGIESGADVEFESATEAAETREALADQVEIVITRTPDDDVFQSFKDLNAQMVKTLPDNDSDLPNIQQVQLKRTAPALVVSYDLFDTIEAEEDIINRNKIRHPGFVPGGRELEVLNVRERS